MPKAVTLNLRDPNFSKEHREQFSTTPDWSPRDFLFHFLGRRRGGPEDGVQDQAQEFLKDFLARDSFARAKKERGKFRSFLLTSIRHHLANSRKAMQRIKLGGGVTFTEIDDEANMRSVSLLKKPSTNAERKSWSTGPSCD